MLTDMGNLGRKFDHSSGSQSSFRATRPGSQLVLGPQDINFSSQSVANAATFTTFTADMAPGGLVAIFGDGLAKPGTPLVISISDQRTNPIKG